MTAFTPTSIGQRLRLYLDEDMTERLLDVLPAFGIDVVSANHGYKGRTDPEQLLVVIGLGRMMVTTNTGDFLLLHQAWHA